MGLLLADGAELLASPATGADARDGEGSFAVSDSLSLSWRLTLAALSLAGRLLLVDCAGEPTSSLVLLSLLLNSASLCSLLEPVFACSVTLLVGAAAEPSFSLLCPAFLKLGRGKLAFAACWALLGIGGEFALAGSRLVRSCGGTMSGEADDSCTSF